MYDKDQLKIDAQAVVEWSKDGCVKPLQCYIDQIKREQERLMNDKINNAVRRFFERSRRDNDGRQKG